MFKTKEQCKFYEMELETRVFVFMAFHILSSRHILHVFVITLCLPWYISKLVFFFFKFDTVWKLFRRFWNHLDTSIQFETVWLESFRSSGKIRTVLKPFRKFWNHLAIFWQPENCEESFEIIPKCPDSFETVWQIWSHQEMSRQFCYMFSLVSMSRMLKLSNSQTEK